MGAIRVYQYGLRPPTAGEQVARDQLRLAHRYRVLLTRLARARRAVERDLELRAGLEEEQRAVAAAAGIRQEAARAARAACQATGKRTAPPAERQAVLDARAAVKEAKERLKARRQALNAALQPERDALHERWLSMRRAARHESGLRHGTYTAVEDALNQSCSDTPLWEDGEPRDPGWPPWDGSGSIGVQLQGGRSLAEVYGSDTQLQIEPLPDQGGNVQRDSKRPVFALLRVRVGSNEDRTPIWAAFPAKFHRAMPTGSRVKRCMVTLHREGPRERWTAELTVEEPDGYLREPCGTGTVAVDIGWRRLDGNRLRVAAWHDDSGAHGQVLLTSEMIGALRKADELRSLRDQGLNALRPKLCTWLREQAELPAWLLAATVRKRAELPSAAQAVAHMAQWRSCARFARLARAWSASRWEGDDDGYELVESWRYRDHHLWEWESGQRAQARRRRREQYRRWAAWLTRTYRTVVFEDFDLRAVARKPDDRRRDHREERAASWRQLACTSELRASVCDAASVRGARVADRTAAYTTQECPYNDCRYTEPWGAAASIQRSPPCPSCGRTWDQDDGAAIVLLRRWLQECERPGGPGPLRPARRRRKRNENAVEGETRWQRVARLRKRKEERMQAARNEPANPA